jgi:hypothetical protein
MQSIIIWFTVAMIALIVIAIVWSGIKVIAILGMIAVAAAAIYKALNLGKLG